MSNLRCFIASLLVAFICALTSVAFAYYPRFWKGDTNYPHIWGHMGAAFYLDKSSIKVKINKPPYYIITAQVIVVLDSDYPGERRYSNDKEAYKNYSHEYFYDEDEMDMREYNPSKDTWHYLGPTYSNAESGRSMAVGEAVFYVAMSRKFYGNYLWKDTDYLDEVKYWDMFADSFYKDLR